MDEKDEKILSVLQENSKLSTHRIAKQTSIPITTVHNRIKKLEKEGIIKQYTIKLDPKKTGKPIAAYILVNVDYNKFKHREHPQEELAKKIMKVDLIETIDILAGGTDIIMKVRTHDLDELNQFVANDLRKFEGVTQTQTMIILSEM